MSTALESLKASSVWNPTYNLPCGPGQNPWIYMAYYDTVLRLNGERLEALDLILFYIHCEVSGKPGLFKRFPDGGGGPTSHDEVMGLFSLMGNIVRDDSATDFERSRAKDIMDRVLHRLDTHLGDFNSHSNPTGWNVFRYNIYRFYWLRPYLSAAAGRNPGIIQQALWCLKLWLGKNDWDTSKTPHRVHMMNWIMFLQMVHAKHLHVFTGQTGLTYFLNLEAHGCNPQTDLQHEPEASVDDPSKAFISPYASTDQYGPLRIVTNFRLRR